VVDLATNPTDQALTTRADTGPPIPSSPEIVAMATRAVPLAGLCSFLFATALAAQTADEAPARSDPPRHPVVCAEGVRRYGAMSEVPAPFDSLAMPRGLPPIRVTSPDEEQAAEREVNSRAGSIGATGLVVTQEASPDYGIRTVRRRAVPVFVAADSARAQAACRAVPSAGGTRP
jgi:hypothetical protein